MVTLLVLGACLLVLAFLFGKRFGTPTLALAAGFLIDGYLGPTLVAVAAPYLKQYVSYLPVALILLPALFLLLFAKGRHRRLPARLVHSVVFAAAGLVFVLAAPSTPASLTGNVPLVTEHVGLIIPALLGLAVLEVAFGRPSKKKVEEPKK